jgi:hypothetical protein
MFIQTMIKKDDWGGSIMDYDYNHFPQHRHVRHRAEFEKISSCPLAGAAQLAFGERLCEKFRVCSVGIK